MHAKTTEDYRTVFSLCGLMFGRHFGSKSRYSANNPGCVYIANACVYSRDGTCVWRGDLDLTSDDSEMLIAASKKMNRMLFVMREQYNDDRIPFKWLAQNAVFTVWRGKVATNGFAVRLYGSFEQIQKRFQTDIRPVRKKQKAICRMPS